MGTHPIFESDFDCLTESRPKIASCRFDSTKLSSMSKLPMTFRTWFHLVKFSPLQSNLVLLWNKLELLQTQPLQPKLDFLVVKSTVLWLVLVRSRVKPQRLTPKKRRRLRPAVPRDACNTTVDSSTLFQHSARRRDQTLTHNYDLKLC